MNFVKIGAVEVNHTLILTTDQLIALILVL